ncbi:hypothetical protein NN561_011695 [Cricetulus griseus]
MRSTSFSVGSMVASPCLPGTVGIRVVGSARQAGWQTSVIPTPLRCRRRNRCEFQANPGSVDRVKIIIV